MTSHLQQDQDNSDRAALLARVQQAAAAAVRTWPQRDQEAVAVGEIGELLTLVGRSAQGRATPDEWATELADVFIMLHQLIALRTTPIGFRQALDAQLCKLEARIERHEVEHPEAKP